MQQQTPYPEFLRVQYQCIPLSPLHLVQEIRDSVTMDNSLHKLIEEKHMDITSHPAYSITSQGLQRKGKWVVGDNSTLRTRIIKEIHDGSSGGYSGRDATRKRISSFCYWRGQTKDIDQYIKNVMYAKDPKVTIVLIPACCTPPKPTASLEQYLHGLHRVLT